jgi:hypothetical protein
MDWYDDDFSENLGIESSAEYLYDFSLTSSRAFPVGYDTPSSIAGEIGGDPERGSRESEQVVPTNEGVSAPAEGTASDTASDSCGVGEGTSGGASTMGDSA